MTLQDVGVLIAIVLAVLGWAYQLGRSDARLHRNEKDIAEIKSSRVDCRRDHDSFEKDLRREMRESFLKVYEKLDALPCHNPGWGKNAGCQ
jgi:hypothetical protein